MSHQVLHHTAQQKECLEKYFKLLKPGGTLLIGESCKTFINTWWVRWFFKHPMHVQKTAQEYAVLIRQMGFEIITKQETIPWWSIPDFGISNKIGLRFFNTNEPTELLIIAKKP